MDGSWHALCSEKNALSVNSRLVSTCSVLISKSTENHLNVPKNMQDPQSFCFPSHVLSGKPMCSQYAAGKVENVRILSQRRRWHPLQYSCLENPMDGGAWWAAVHGVVKSRTWLSDFTFMHCRRKWQPTPVFLPGASQGQGSLVGCCLWGHTESDKTEVT